MLTVKRKRVELANGVVGLVSDTHGLVREEALAALRGCDLIIHAGDIGKSEVVGAFKSIAPVIAIRGNNDREPWAQSLSDVVDLRVNGVKLYVIHDVHDLRMNPAKANVGAVISGHSHKPVVMRRDGVIFINPGSAGPRRFKLPVAVAKLIITGDKVQARIMKLRI